MALKMPSTRREQYSCRILSRLQLSRSKVLLNEQEGQEPPEQSREQAFLELTAIKYPHEILIVVHRLKTALIYFKMLRSNTLS